MKLLIAAVFLTLSGLSAVAVLMAPGDPYPGKPHFVRSSDYHPRRSVELAAFNRLYPDLWLTP